MATYRVKGKAHWVGDQRIPVGGTVEIQGDLPAGLADRLELEAPSVVVVVTTTEAKGWGLLPPSTIGKLSAAGFDTPEKVIAASDADILKIDGIAEGTLKVIREILA
jgi:hypothetical protein